MSSDFKIEISNWLPGYTGAPEVRETVAELSIKVKELYATEIEDRRARSVRRTIRVSAYTMATWLVANWWRLCWEPHKKQAALTPRTMEWEMSHELAASGGGYVWPPITLSSDGYQMLVRCDGVEKSASESLSPIRYLNSFEQLIDVSSFEAGVSSFVYQVLARLDVTGVRNSSLHELWAEVGKERAKKPLETKRKLEALLGLDPEQDDALIRGISKWQSRIGQLALEEIAAASGTEDIKEVLVTTAKAADAVKTFSRIAEYQKIKSLLADKGSLSDCVPWVLGKTVACVVRDIWGLKRKPINNRTIADCLHINEAILSEKHSDKPLAVGIRGPQEEQLKLLLRPGHRDRQRFEVARLIGDHLGIDSKEKWKPATHAVTARQRFQRAFAAEFLCPSDELYERYHDEILQTDDIEEKALDIAREYQVSQQVVLNHLANRKLIDASLWRGPGIYHVPYAFVY